MIIGLIVILLVIVLWVGLLLRNAALAVVIAVSPIAAGQAGGEATRAWWTRTVSACAQLIILKPIIEAFLQAARSPPSPPGRGLSYLPCV